MLHGQRSANHFSHFATPARISKHLEIWTTLCILSFDLDSDCQHPVTVMYRTSMNSMIFLRLRYSCGFLVRCGQYQGSGQYQRCAHL